MDLKLNFKAIRKLKSDFKIDLLAGDEFDLKEPDVLIAFLVSCSQHWAKPITKAQAENDIDFVEVMEAVGNLFNKSPGKTPAAKRAAKKKTRS